MQHMKLTERPLGEALEAHERKRLYACIVGGVSWPCRQPGYAVILGFGRDSEVEPYRIVVLDECIDFDLQELYIQATILDQKWSPHKWFADTDNEAAQQIQFDYYRECEKDNPRHERMYITPALVLGTMKPELLYGYILPKIRSHLKHDRKKLFLKDSQVRQDLEKIDDGDLPDFNMGDRPSIEALAFALLEIEKVHEALTYKPRYRRRTRDPMLT